ncbi:AraC family transcriptional regulator [Acanthopleuribacter pedis]|uniref:AraC family transcriptional regulator n=1 Tax=Acanthopleuribacter pedis TaxID=442870 RepID=A0A8J7U645_9BACT|nr:AraC family transcriptional regulator [Acanthopleuribacter pedis]MBO1322382.1 AraC family transcriptional regulator [Acanthopleuribacter pedis]
MKASTVESYRLRLWRVLDFIQARLDEPLPVADLAAVACFSQHHFHRVFRGMVGETVQNHVRRLRLERAALALRHGDSGILDIAQDAGYESNEAFSRAFKQHCGVAPSVFRERRELSFPRRPGAIAFGQMPPIDDLIVPGLGGPLMKVELVTRETLRLAGLRHVGPYNQCGNAWEKLLPMMGKLGWLSGCESMVGLCHDDPESTPAEEIRYDACVVVDETFEAFDDVTIHGIPGGTFARTVHVGPYDTLNKTYAALCGTWLPQSGHETRDEPAFEIYINDPESTEPEDLVTEIYLPIV